VAPSQALLVVRATWQLTLNRGQAGAGAARLHGGHLSAQAQENVRLWEEHLHGEFVTKNENLSLSTMVEDASVIPMPTGWGGKGQTALRPLYRDEFIPSIPPAWEHALTNRVATDNCVVEEARVRFRHTKQMDWFLPGVPPTGK
jgi:hypothetical protein